MSPKAPAASRRVRAAIGILAVTVAGLSTFAVFGLAAGRPDVPVVDLWSVLSGAGDERVRIALVDLRAPRLVLALLAGAALGLAGALLQDGLRNPIAAPELLGVSNGCAVVVAAIAILGLPVPRAAVTPMALAGGMAVGAVAILVGMRLRSTVAQVLCGLAFSSVLSGAIVALVTLGAPANAGLLYQFLLGSLANRGWADVQILVIWCAVAVPAALVLARSLNVLRLGDDAAATLGIAVLRTRIAVLAVASLLTAAVVAVCGPIGFVALVAPHLVRSMLGTVDARWVLPMAAAVGALVLVAADQTARMIADPRELAAGMVTALVGAPLLVAMLQWRRMSVLS
ncbi:iron ABC transporter permease [Nocardioides sp. R-C-SC26]|uniref:FecCD family ABC transporter permease n=1 Tax=Nocardioides sp. R-C-SC26 TaxID=2870414 RepID=UPI001E3C545D|nr:iron ABC transporter permease [Nocardioides sp. R-C-SC26]